MDAFTIANHPTIVALTTASSIIAALDEQSRNIASVSELNARVDYLLWVVEQTDPNLLSRQELDSLSGHAQHLSAYVSSIASSPEANATSAGSQLDSYFARFPYPRFRKIPRAESQRIIELVQAQADEAIAQITTRINSATSDLDGLMQMLTTQKNSSLELTNRTTVIEEQQRELSRRVENFYDKTSSTLEAKIDERLAEANSRLTISIDEFLSKVSDERAHATSQLSQISSDGKNLLANSEKILEESVTNISSQGKEYLKKIREIYGIVGGDASSGQLIVSANGEFTAYKWLGAAALIAFLGGSYFAYSAIQPALLPGVDWYLLAGRFGLVVASYIPAWFLSSLAAKHRQAELAYRSLAVRVAAFDPYLSEFEVIDRIGVKKQLAEMFFSPILQNQTTEGLRIKDLKDFERLITPIEAILDRVKSLSTRT